MDLKKRLASLDRLTRKPEKSLLEPPGETLFGPGGGGEVACAHLGLRAQSTPFGACYFRDLEDGLPPPAFPLPDFQGFLSQPGDGSLQPGEILFLDTETTGLAGGTGTMTFVVGVSWWEGKRLRTRQLFLVDPSGEPALLHTLHQLAAPFRSVVTYNGSSFDLPLLRTRALLNRMPHPWEDLLGWDLLVPSRRIWGRTLENCRQQTVEKQVGAVPRDQRDLPGHLIPQTWFDFLQGRDVQGVQRVLYHNWRDMAGMAAIFLDTVHWAGRLDQAGCHELQDAQLAWALGRIAERRRQTPASLRWMHQAWNLTRRQSAARDEERFCQDLVRILKRGGDWTLVENVIAWVLESGHNEPWVHREAAILYEHRLGNLERARHHALAAGDEYRLLRIKRRQRPRKDSS